MNARDELAAVVAKSYYLMQGGAPEGVEQAVVVAGDMQLAADIEAAGYVKMPSREALARAISERCGYRWEQIPPMSASAQLDMADAILALLAGETS